MAKTETKQEMTTVADIVNAIAAGEIAPGDGAALIATLSSKPTRAVARTIKLNSSGGLYVTDPTFKAWSTKKSKNYIAGVNMDVSVAKALFSNPDLIAEINAFLADPK